MNRTDDAVSSPIRENTRPLFSLSRDTLATTLRPEPLANQPPLTQAYIFRSTPAQVAPTLGARPILLRAGVMMLSLAVHCHRSRSPPSPPRALVSAIAPSSCQPSIYCESFCVYAPLLVVYIIFLNVQNFQIQHNNANNV